MPNISISQQDNQSTYRVRVGDELTLRLEAVPGTGYSWNVAGGLPDLLEQTGEPAFEKSGGSTLGGSEQQVFKFRVRAAGDQALRLEYRRPWEKGGTAAKFFSISLNAEA